MTAGGADVRLRGWGWRHAGRRSLAVQGIDLTIEPGERVLLLGPSGAGKSTLLLALAGILGGAEEGDEFGELTVGGVHPSTTRGVAGLVLQDPDTQAVLARVGDDVAFPCENLGVPRDEIWRRVRESLDAVGLDVPLDRSTSALSGGQKQRLALAGALAMRPRLLLLDEPTANLDPEGVAEVSAAVGRVAERTGATLVVIEHRVAVWRDLVDRIVVLGRDGGVLADGTPDSVLDDAAPALVEAGVWLPDRRPERATDAARGLARSSRHPTVASAPGSPAHPLLDRSPALTARGLSVGRRAFAARTATAVATDIDAELALGSVTAVTGPNGVGKSTLALTLAGLLEPVAGTVEAGATVRAGVDPSPRRWRSRELLTRIGTVFQEPEHQFLTGRVEAELALGPTALGFGAADVEAIVAELLDGLGLAALAGANPFTLSGGEKRRLSVATVLATDPHVLVLDEPTFGQDARTWATLVGLLAERAAAGRAIVAVTHDRDVIDALGADELRLSQHGALLVAGAGA